MEPKQTFSQREIAWRPRELLELCTVKPQVCSKYPSTGTTEAAPARRTSVHQDQDAFRPPHVN